MPKLELDFSGFDQILDELNKMGEDAKEVTDDALREAFKIITRKAEDAIQKPNLPRQGKYSNSDSEKSLVHDPKITWNDSVASVDVGFNIKKGGLPTIFMMYGTPRYMKVQALYDAFFGEQTEAEIFAAVSETYAKKLGG